MHRTHSRRVLVMAASVLTGVLALSACSAPDSSPEQSSAQRDADITLAILGTPPTLNPTQLDEGQSALIWSAVLDTLLVVDENGELQPNAAESWEYSDDATQLTLRLRDGMTFSSGDPVTSAAVVETMTRLRDTPGPNQGRLESVETLEAPDDLTVVVNFSEPDSTFLEDLALSPGVIGDPATLDDEDSALRPVGSGPYVIDESATVDGSTYVLSRRDDYWNADAYPFSKLTVRVIADSAAAFNALQAGEIDANTVRPDQAAQLSPDAFTLKEIAAANLASIVFLDRAGEVQPALADERVRQAINMAFDRAGFVEGVLRGAGVPTEQIFNPMSPVYDASLEGTYEFDVEAARSLMADAGYADGFNVSLPSTFISTTFEPLLTEALAEIGVNATWEPVPAQEVASSLSTKKYPMAFYVRGLTSAAGDINGYYAPNGFLNPFGVVEDEMADLLRQEAAATDPDSLVEVQRDINALAVEKAYAAPLFYIGSTWATTPGIEYLGTGASSFPTIRFFGTAD
jgi:peptide/nickel transport system substrate-binding protein